jgi:large subunit ribosomal protein L35
MINRPTRLTRSVLPVSQINSTARVRVLQQPQQCVFASTAATAEVEQAESNDQVYRSQANKPLKPSVEKAFQESMKYLKQDAERLQSKLKDLQTSQEITRSPEEIERLAILSAVNDVQVRKNHKLGEQVDMSKPIYRFLEQQRWRKGGQLGRLVSLVFFSFFFFFLKKKTMYHRNVQKLTLLHYLLVPKMETIHRLRIFPDLFPSIDPSVDLQIKFQDNYLQDAHRSINIGNFVPSSKVNPVPTPSSPSVNTSFFF